MLDYNKKLKINLNHFLKTIFKINIYYLIIMNLQSLLTNSLITINFMTGNII